MPPWPAAPWSTRAESTDQALARPWTLFGRGFLAAWLVSAAGGLLLVGWLGLATGAVEMALYVVPVLLAAIPTALVLMAVVLSAVLLPWSIVMGVAAAIERALRSSRYREAVARGPRLAVHRERPSTGARVRGRVRLTGPVRRVVGEAAWGEIDDAEVAPFSIETEEGPVSVDPAQLWLDLPVRAPRPLDLTLPHFPRAPVRATLAEAILREGQEVELEGPTEASVQSDGYRNQTVTHRFVGPLRVSPCRPPKP